MRLSTPDVAHEKSSVASAIAALALVLAVAAPGYFSAREPERSVAGQSAGAARRDRHDAGHRRRRDRHLGRVGVRGLRRGGGRPRKGRDAGAGSRAPRPACWARAFGSLNGALVAYAGIPSIVVTLATMVALRDGLRWATEGAWVQDLPPAFQWLGLTQARVSAGRRRRRCGDADGRVRLGAAPPRGGPRGLCRRIQPGRRAPRRARRRSGRTAPCSRCSAR